MFARGFASRHARQTFGRVPRARASGTSSARGTFRTHTATPGASTGPTMGSSQAYMFTGRRSAFATGFASAAAAAATPTPGARHAPRASAGVHSHARRAPTAAAGGSPPATGANGARAPATGASAGSASGGVSVAATDAEGGQGAGLRAGTSSNSDEEDADSCRHGNRRRRPT